MTNTAGEDVLSLVPKNAEMSNVKVFDKDDNEMDLEQMLITSAFNVQIDKVFKRIPPYEKAIRDLTMPAELECFHFSLDDFMLNFKKGYLEATVGWKHVEEISNPELCDRFNDMLKNGPKKAASAAGGGMDGLMDHMGLEKDMIKDHFGADFAGYAQAMQGYDIMDKGVDKIEKMAEKAVNYFDGEDAAGEA